MRKNAGNAARILIVDDNPEIHGDIKKILQRREDAGELEALFADIVGKAVPDDDGADFQIDSAYRGEDAVSMVRLAKQERKPYALAYVDMRIPSGLDGLQIIRRLQQEDHQLQYVVITAYSDYSWHEISAVLLSADKLLILKKPFEAIEIRQSASALIEKWHLAMEHKQALSALVMQRNMLEEHVREQTAELRHANEMLTKEVKERRRAEEKIRLHRNSLEKQIELRGTEIVQQNRFLSTVINSLPHPFAVIEIATCRILAANRTADRPGADGDPARICHQYMHGLARPCPEHGLPCPLQAVREQGCPVMVEHVCSDASGSEQIMEVHACPVADQQGQITRAVEYCIDVTRKRKMEEELIRNRKLETVSKMAKGVAHDFNNLLMAIAGNIELALMQHGQEQVSCEFLRNAAASAAEAKELAHKFLLFSSLAPPARQAVAVADLIGSACNSILAPVGVTPKLELPDDLWPVYADPGQIEQVLRELLKNSVEAMPPNCGRQITVGAENVDLHARDAAGRREGRYVRMTVQDEGCGIRKEDLPKIFDPYFSGKTRGSVKGAGLGLTIAASIVSQHEGYMEADSEFGVGTAVHVELLAATKE